MKTSNSQSPEQLPGSTLATALVAVPFVPLETPTVEKKKSYLPGLNPLRAIAAISVCLFHFTGAVLPKLTVPALKAAFSQGVVGVIIFFVISGFIIPYSLIGKNHQVKGFFAYMKKRVLRINPPAYASLLLVIGQAFLVTKLLHKSLGAASDFSWVQLLHNLLFTIPFTHYEWINGVFWTLAVEFQFYVFIGLLFVVLFERNLMWFVALYLGAVALYHVPFFQSADFFRYASVFALGGLALLWQQQRISLAVYIAGIALFSSLAFWEFGIYTAVVAVGTTLAINMLKVSVPGLSFLGKISYSLYLIHIPVGTTLEFILTKLFPPTSDVQKVVLTFVCVAVTIAASAVFYQLVERPFMKWAAQRQS